ncbi:MAG: O-antigen ligase family protein, partial [Oxalobacteraceae bacterium]
MSLSRVLTIALPFIPFLIWALLSITWSEYPGISLRRSARLVIEMTGVLLLAMSYAKEPERFIRIFFYVCLGIVAIDLVILPIPSYSWTQIGYVGLHFHKQFTGRFIFVAAPLFIIAIAHPRFQAMQRLGFAGLAICILLLPLTQAKTIWVALPVALVGAAVLLGMFRETIQKPIIAFACFGLCGLIGLSMTVGLDTETLLERVFGDATLTGRDQIWRFAFSKYYGNEALGVGYGALWQTGTEVVDRLRDGYKIYVVNEAHNGYI